MTIQIYTRTVIVVPERPLYSTEFPVRTLTNITTRYKDQKPLPPIPPKGSSLHDKTNANGKRCCGRGHRDYTLWPQPLRPKPPDALTNRHRSIEPLYDMQPSNGLKPLQISRGSGKMEPSRRVPDPRDKQGRFRWTLNCGRQPKGSNQKSTKCSRLRICCVADRMRKRRANSTRKASEMSSNVPLDASWLDFSDEPSTRSSQPLQWFQKCFGCFPTRSKV